MNVNPSNSKVMCFERTREQTTILILQSHTELKQRARQCKILLVSEGMKEVTEFKGYQGWFFGRLYESRFEGGVYQGEITSEEDQKSG